MSTVDELRWAEVVEADQAPAPGPDLDDNASDPPQGVAAPPRELDLVARFVEQLIEGALETRRTRHPSEPDPVVDWAALWAIGTGSTSMEQGVGQMVVAADALAKHIAAGKSSPQSPPTLDKISQTQRMPLIVGTPALSALARERPSVTASSGSAIDRVDVPLPPLAVFPPKPTPATFPDQSTLRPSVRALRREHLATAFGWVRNVGLALILFAGWQLWGTSLAQHQAQQSLKQQFTARVRQAPTTPAAPSLVSADAGLPEPAEGSVVARLRIPAIGVDQYVVEGTAEGDLQKGPGHYIGTAMPGQAGNVAIAGHRTTYGAPFNNLNSMVPGDEIDLTTDSGMTLDYIVTQPPVAVAPSDVKILNYFGDNRLTLTTCNPRYSASQRLVVVALLRSPVGPNLVTSSTKTVASRSKPPVVAGGGSVGWNLSYLPAVLAVLLFIVLLSLVNRRAALYYGRRGRWFILVPIWVASVYLLFGLLSSFVPSTL